MEGFNLDNGKCANQRLSQPRASPHLGWPKLCQKPPETSPRKRLNAFTPVDRNYVDQKDIVSKR